jgi:excisionase family DNA binding protein
VKADDAVRAVTVRIDLDPWFSLRALADYSSLSRRTLQDLVHDATDPIPSYKVGGKILVRRSEFDAWMTRRRNQKALAAARLAAADARALLATRPRGSRPALDTPRDDAYTGERAPESRGGT